MSLKVVFSLLLPSACTRVVGQGLQQGAPWPSFRFNEANTGRSPYSGGSCPYGVTSRWNFSMPTGSSSTPIIATDGTIYIPSDSMYAVNTDTATLKLNFSYSPSTGAIAADGTIYTFAGPATARYVYACNTSTGTTRQLSISASSSIVNAINIGSNGLAYISAGAVYALDIKTGLVRWDTTSFASGAFTSTPIIGPNGLVFALRDVVGKLYAINASTGALKWTYQAGNQDVVGSPALGDDGTLYFTAWDQYLYAVSSVSGSLLWKYKTGGIIYSSPAVASDGTVYVVSDTVYAIRNNVLRWSYAVNAQTESSPAIGADGTVYVGADNNQLLALNGNTGALLWSYSTNGSIRASPVIGIDGTVYVSSMDAHVYALICASPSPTASNTGTSSYTPTQTQTSTQSASSSFTAAPTTATRSASTSPSCTVSSSPTHTTSMTASASRSATGTESSSRTVSPSGTVSRTVDPSISSTATASHATMSTSSTASATPLPTPLPTPVMDYVAFLSYDNGGCIGEPSSATVLFPSGCVSTGVNTYFSIACTSPSSGSMHMFHTPMCVGDPDSSVPLDFSCISTNPVSSRRACMASRVFQPSASASSAAPQGYVAVPLPNDATPAIAAGVSVVAVIFAAAGFVAFWLIRTRRARMTLSAAPVHVVNNPLAQGLELTPTVQNPHRQPSKRPGMSTGFPAHCSV